MAATGSLLCMVYMYHISPDGRPPHATTNDVQLAGHRSDARVCVSARALTAQPSTAHGSPIVKSAQLTHTARRMTRTQQYCSAKRPWRAVRTNTFEARGLAAARLLSKRGARHVVVGLAAFEAWRRRSDRRHASEAWVLSPFGLADPALGNELSFSGWVVLGLPRHLRGQNPSPRQEGGYTASRATIFLGNV